jgi:predicted RNA-binding Zn-ribbon protein involved in translation (DUF1610 family)
MIISKKKAIYKEKNKRKKAPYTKDQRCPDCGNIMKVRDSKRRGTRYQVRRYYCRYCDRIHTELPNDLPPYMRKETDIIQGAVDGVPDEDSAEDSTINRWRTKYIPKLEGILTAAGLDIPPREPGRRWLAEILQIIYVDMQKHTHCMCTPAAGVG